MPGRCAHTRNDMETDETEETTPIPTLRRSKRLAPYYVDVEAKHSGEKSIGSQRLVSGYTFPSDDSDSASDSDDEWIPAQQARSHDSSVRPDNGVRGPGKQRRRKRARRSNQRDNSKNSAKRSNQREESQPNPHILPTEPISFRRRQRKQSHPNRAALP